MAWNGAFGGPIQSGAPVGTPLAFLVSYREIHATPAMPAVLKDAATKAQTQLETQTKPNAHAPPPSAIAPDAYISADGNTRVYRPDGIRQVSQVYTNHAFERYALRMAATKVLTVEEAGILLKLYTAEQSSKLKMRQPKPLPAEGFELEPDFRVVRHHKDSPDRDEESLSE